MLTTDDSADAPLSFGVSSFAMKKVCTLTANALYSSAVEGNEELMVLLCNST